MIYKILSVSEGLSDTPSTVSDANRVLLQHNANAGASHLVTLKSDAGAEGGVAVVGTFWIHPGQDIVIEKYKLYTLEVGTAVTDVQATYVGVTG
jgi:hypothetical protein